MTKIKAEVEIRLTGLKRFHNKVTASTSAIQTKVIKQWAARYRGFVQRRFASNSKGGGGWPPLSEFTIAARRKGGGSGKPAILRDTGILFNALAPTFTNAPGALEEKQGFGVIVGYGGPGRHPKGGATISDIASFHQVGAGRLPKRTIIVPPDDVTKQGMIRDAENALNKEAVKDIGDGT